MDHQPRKKAPDFSDARFHIRALTIAAMPKRQAAMLTLTVMLTTNIVGYLQTLPG
jgi:hypothetical protein